LRSIASEFFPEDLVTAWRVNTLNPALACFPEALKFKSKIAGDDLFLLIG
jgi:hypothetical protein